MPVRDRQRHAPPRRLQHAHRVRQPVGPLDQRRALLIRPRRRDGARWAGLTLALAVGALLAVAIRPWDGLADAGGVDTGAIATSIPAEAEGLAAPTMGPHGDVVTAVDPPHEGIADSHAAWLAGTAGPLPPALLTGYDWPLHDARITNGFGPGRPGSFVVDGTTFHDGLDISSFCGARITAAHDGVVLAAGRHAEEFLGWVGDLGPFRAKLESAGGWGGQAIAVVIDDANGYRSVYAHLGLAVVERGTVVRAGDLLGYEGASGNATGCHLHFALYSPRERSTLALDPKVARKTKLPPAEIARIDPLLVLPPLGEADITWGWGAR